MTILSALSSFSRNDFSSNSLPMTLHRRACRTVGRNAYAGSLCASAGTGNTRKYPAAGDEHRVDGMTARYDVPAGGLCEEPYLPS